jgi:serine protease AprX
VNAGVRPIEIKPTPGSIRRCFLRAASDQRRAALVPMLRLPESVYFSKSEPNLLIANVMPDEESDLFRNEGVRVIPTHKYEPLEMAGFDQVYQPLEHHEKSLNDVLTHIRARLAWKRSTGRGVHIAIVDTGVCGGMAEFPAWKRSPHKWSYHGSPWTDLKGHGSMTACIAAATSNSGGRFDGVAPGATLISCKTSFEDTELYEIYDYLIGLVEKHEIGKLVINNSFGSYLCSPPAIASDDPFQGIVRLAVTRGITVVFAAGKQPRKRLRACPSCVRS